MRKPLTQEQVDKLIEKQVAAAVKAETKRVLEIIKEAATANKDVEDKAIKAHVANVIKGLQNDVKAAA